MVYFIVALATGVFYREFTKFNGFTGRTALGYAHTHLLVLGMFLFLILAVLEHKDGGLTGDRLFSRFFILYNIALPLMVCMLLVRGAVQVSGLALSSAADAAISGIAGISHVLIAAALWMLFVLLKKRLIPRESV